ncbi:MAG TPA: N,N-dimethylformamidase beta subunit family domain-containing protein, partial [Pseudonocardiaceae bacterium]|nr:N,N-dimethylformamidase beta subunit family domain-containing protein [Pseudonocardiaceae bacterium]
MVIAAPAAVAALPCDPPVSNPVACENTKPGTDGWRAQSTDPSIAGFTTDLSVNQGETVNFKINTVAPSYRVDLYRLGWYGGIGARQVAALSRSTPQTQPACLTDPPTGLIDCGNWAVSLSWQVPADAVSGIYYAALRRNDGGGENEIVFIVRDDASTSKILFQTSDSTWQAYNRYGGNSLYNGTGPGPQGSAYKVSYNRPMFGYPDENFIFNAEYPMLRFLEANGYDLSYTTDIDTARRGQLIRNHQVFMPIGHDEYWSNEQRNNVETARAAGVHLAFFTANEIFWKTRWEPSLDSTATPWRTVVTYKETRHDGKIDPSPEWTGTWRDARFSPPSDGGRPENALVGNMFTVNGRRDDSLVVPAAHGKMRLWRDTSLANLPAGQSYTFAPGTLGYEWNSVVDNGFTPPGLAQLSRTTVTMDGNYVLLNEGDEYGPGTQTHALTLYRDHSSGALVFGAGTLQWAWGLDDEHAHAGEPTSDVRMKQATVNLLADMGVQPATLQSGLVAATASADVTPPSVAITSAVDGQVGQANTYSGTVSDTGGQVAGVEVSVDGGTRWHPADWTIGSGTWSYTFTPAEAGQATLQVRAVDDSARLSAPAARAIAVGPQQCPCFLWPETTVPDIPAVADPTPLELGVKFRADTDGYIRGVKFYKGPGNNGTHTGSLWSAAGQRLTTGTFTGETSDGWQTLMFPVPVAITGGTTYVASYFTPAGHYAAEPGYFATADRRLDPLTGLRSGVDGPNGVYLAGNPGFPSSTYRASNYWVDVVYALDPGPDTRAPEISSTTPITGAGSVGLDGPVTATFDEPLDPPTVQLTLTGPEGTGIVGTVSTASNDTVVRFQPAAALAGGTTYTATVTARDREGNALASPVTWSFTTGSPRPAGCPCTIWDDFTVPAVRASLDSSAVELGTKVRFDGKGAIMGIRFYKGAGNTGTHTGSLWSATGQQLATGTFTGETTEGWQTLAFSVPIEVDANTTYVVSYYAPNGHYAANSGYFSPSGADYGALHALRSGVDGGNAVYRYGSGGGFPTASYNATNYWVDVIYRSGLNGDTTPPTLTAQTPAAGASGVPLSGVVTGTFSEPVDLGSAQFSLTDPGGTKLAVTPALSADQKTVTWTPTAPLAAAT